MLHLGREDPHQLTHQLLLVVDQQALEVVEGLRQLVRVLARQGLLQEAAEGALVLLEAQHGLPEEGPQAVGLGVGGVQQLAAGGLVRAFRQPPQLRLQHQEGGHGRVAFREARTGGGVEGLEEAEQ
ncbi:MAG: hypothetical protein IPO28_11810 [Holophagaceae bacterium]|nr:hypothetical protein [Holophagaceae bacterium]